jgi:hypothetical protein
VSALVCSGRVTIGDEVIDLSTLVFTFVDDFEPSLVVIHRYEANAGDAIVRVEVVEDGSGVLFASVDHDGADLRARYLGNDVELRARR